MNIKKTLLLISSLLFFCALVNAQSKTVEPNIVQGDANACELNAAMFDALANILRDFPDERLFVIARLGKGEISREFNRRRLYNVRTYFKDGWPKLDTKRFMFTEGDRFDGEGRVEFYVGSKLMLISLVKRGRDICVDCCDYPDLRYYGSGKKDKSKGRNR